MESVKLATSLTLTLTLTNPNPNPNPNQKSSRLLRLIHKRTNYGPLIDKDLVCYT